MKSLTVLYCSILICALGVPLHAQTTSLNGTVTDPTGAIVSHASITLESSERGGTRAAVSDDAGRYSFQLVQPGGYRLTAKVPGFADITMEGIRLLVNAPSTVDIRFEQLATTVQSVSVEGAPNQVNTVDASLGNAIGTRPIMELPLEGRNIPHLLSLQPGVTCIGNSEQLERDYRQGSVGGGKSDQANITLDGVDVNDQQSRYAFSSVLRSTLDSVQEFRVTTVNPTADLGRSGGAQIAMTTKSGTNEYHGSLYEYHRNTLTSANRFFNNAVVATPENPKGGVERQKLIRNVFGASFGGPVKQNRLFYFVNYEGRREARDGSAVRVVPSAELRQGVVRYLNKDRGVSQLTPADLKRIDPLGLGVNQAALEVLQSYPMPNTDEVGDGLDTRGFRFKAATPVRWNTYIAKIDTYLDKAARHSLFVRGNLQNDRQSDLPEFPGQPAARVILDNSKGVAVGYTAVLRPTLIATTHYGFTRQGGESSGGLNTNYVALHRDLSLPFSPFYSLARTIPVHQLSEDAGWTHGSHNVRFGGIARFVQNKRTDNQNSFFSASANPVWLLDTGDELLNGVTDLNPGFDSSYKGAVLAALGGITQVNAQYNYDLKGNALEVGAPQFRNFANREYELYVQDSWNVRRGLTITAGLRWSLMPPVYETQGYQTTVLPNLSSWFGERAALAAAGRSQAEAGNLSIVRKSDPGGRPLYPFDKKLFSPRLAIAYTPRADAGWKRWLFGGEGRTTVRAGAGILYDIFGQSIMSLSSANQLGFSASLQNPSGFLSLAKMPRYTSATAVPMELAPEAPPSGFPQIPPVGVPQIGSTIDDTLRAPYSINLNFSVAREFSHGFVVEGSYVGRLSRRILTEMDMAMPTNLTDRKSGQTYFHAAQALAIQARNGVPVEQVQPMPFWENVFPGAAAGGLTATQQMYRQVRGHAPDYLTVLNNADAWGYPAYSSLGQFAMFQSQYAALMAVRNAGRASYHAMQWTVRKRFSSGLQMDANYTWSKSIDWGSLVENELALPGTGGWAMTGLILNAWNPRQNIGVSDWDITHQFNMHGILELPFGHGRRFGSGIGKGWNAVLGGWQVAGIFRWTSGLPAFVYNGLVWPTEWCLAGYGTPTGPLQTETGSFKNAPSVDRTGGANIFRDPQKALDSYTFTLPGETGARNALRGDGVFSLDGSLSKRFVMPYRDSHSVQLRWEVFNATNTARFDPRSISNFLTISGSFGKYSEQIVEPRVMQFGLRYEF